MSDVFTHAPHQRVSISLFPAALIISLCLWQALVDHDQNKACVARGGEPIYVTHLLTPDTYERCRK